MVNRKVILLDEEITLTALTNNNFANEILTFWMVKNRSFYADTHCCIQDRHYFPSKLYI